MFRRIGVAGVFAIVVCGPWFQVRAASAQGAWLDVPFIKQTEDGCGSASLAMVMQYWLAQEAKPVDSRAKEETIQRAIFSPEAHGIYASAMKRYLERNGFRAFAFAGDMEMLQHHVEKGRPLIVALEPERGTPLHYEVVVGVDPRAKIVLVNDPATRKLLKQDEAVFAKQWKATGNWTLLAVPGESAH